MMAPTEDSVRRLASLSAAITAERERVGPVRLAHEAGLRTEVPLATLRGWAARAEALEAVAAVVGALTSDDLLAWGASIYEDFWQCHWCRAHGADIDEEPRAEDHAATCPWRLARAALAGAAAGAGR